MLRRVTLLAVLALVLAGCGSGSAQQTHGVLGEQTTLRQSKVERQLSRIDWTLRRAEAKLAKTRHGPARARVLALTQRTLRTEADRLERTKVPPRLSSRKATLVLALRALARDGTLAGTDIGTVRAALEGLGSGLR